MSIILTHDCQSDSAVLTGGSWVASLPLSNLQSQRLSRIARTNNATLASTKLLVEFSRIQSLRAFVAGPTNLQDSYQYRVVSYSDAFVTLDYDSGWITPQAGLPPYASQERRLWVTHILPFSHSSRHWSLELNDTTNPEGFVDIGRLFLGNSWVPSNGIVESNNGLNLANAASISTAFSGAKTSWRRLNPRVYRFGLNIMDESEVFGAAYDFMSISGFDQQVFVIPDPGDTEGLQQRAFLGTLAQMTAIQRTVYQLASTGYEIKEVI